jgi:hypothetical protein
MATRTDEMLDTKVLLLCLRTSKGTVVLEENMFALPPANLRPVIGKTWVPLEESAIMVAWGRGELQPNSKVPCSEQ